MGIEALLSTQIIDTTTVGRAVMTAADAAAARTAIDAAATSHTHAAGDITSGIIGTARLATGTADSTTYLRGDQTWATVAAAGVGGSTGAVDNAVLRADGTGGSTVQSSSIVIADNATASPNNTVNHASIQATGGTTNVSVSIVPKGTGAFMLAVPDGTATGGNARGANAVDLQTVRTAATQVAASQSSALIATQSCTISSGGTATAIIASASVAMSTGNYCAVIAAQDATVSPNTFCAAIASYAPSISTVNQSVVLASQYASASRSNQIAFGSGRWAAAGDRQSFWLTGGAKTTTNAAVEIEFGLGIGNVPVYVTLAAGRQISGMLTVQGCKSDGSVSARYCRLVTIRRVSNTTTLDDSSTVGTDLASSTSLSVTADSTNHRLNVSPTGISGETWRWQAEFQGIEQAYGT